MSTHRPRISRADAERLLDTGTGGPQALSALLAAATPPTAAGEPAGEHAALAEFRAARLATVPPRRRIPMLKAALANLIAVKVAAGAAVAAAATGGIALAAASGNLPAPLQGAAHSAFGAPAAHGASQASSAHGRPHGAPVPASTAASTAPTFEPSESNHPSGTATPSPSLRGLCNAFQAGATSNPGKALANPAFSVLVTAAGGKANVAAFCVTLIGPAPTHHAGAPSTHPSGAPSTHRGGPPSTHPGVPGTHPGGRPTSHPTGAPSSHPGRP
jgi:hypothetical protein